jgi:SAM-dependent methyltransferase
MVNSWDQRYASETYIYGIEPNDWFAEKLNIMKTGRLLLPGEGEGRNAVWAASIGWDVTAVDQSPEGQRKALQLATDKDVTINYQVKDIRCFRNHENSFDAIGLIYLHMPAEYRRKVHHELINMLKPGGCLILEAFSKEQFELNSGGPKDLNLLYDPDEIKEDFKSLRVLEFHNIRIHLEEGELHQGIADVIRLFARKPVS